MPRTGSYRYRIVLVLHIWHYWYMVERRENTERTKEESRTAHLRPSAVRPHGIMSGWRAGLLCCSLCGSAAALQAVSPVAAPSPRAPIGALFRATSSQRRAPTPLATTETPPEDQRWELRTLGLRTRRWLYETLEPFDKGDFRWEFLVPWTNKTLTQFDKFIVCSTFIGLSFSLQTVLDPGASVGVHLSYIAQFFSYAMGDPIGFRLLAVLTALLEIGGAHSRQPARNARPLMQQDLPADAGLHSHGTGHRKSL